MTDEDQATPEAVDAGPADEAAPAPATPSKQARRARRRTLFKRAILGSFLLLLVLGEITCRVLANEWSQFNIFIGAHREFDAQRKWKLRKNYDSKGIKINSRGFLGPEFEPKQEPGSFRIVVLGDSCSFAPAIRPWPRVLEEELRKLRPNKRIEVINSACGGYSSVESRKWYETETVDYDHDMVVIYLGWNDMGQFNPDGVAVKMDEVGYLEEPSLLQRALLNIYMLRSIYVVQGYMERNRPVSHAPLSPADQQRYAAWYPKHFEENLRALIKLARSRGRTVFLMNYAGLVVQDPTPAEQKRMHFPRGLGKSLPKYRHLMQTYEGVLAKITKATKVPLIDIKSLFPTVKSREVFTDSCHFSPQGSEIIGTHVAKAILKHVR